MKKVTFFVLTIFLLSFSTAIAQHIYYSGQLYTAKDSFISEEDLIRMGFFVAKNGRVYLIKDKNLVTGRNGDLLVNFEKYYPNVYKIVNDNLFVHIDFLVSFLNLKKAGNFYFDTPINFQFLELKDNTLRFQIPEFVPKENIIVEVVNNKIRLSFLGFSIKSYDSRKLPSDFQVLQTERSVSIIAPEKYQEYSLNIDKGIISLVLIPKIEGTSWSKKTETFSGRTFSVNYIVVNPKVVNITPVLPTKGIGSRATLKNILDSNGFYHGINANYFDPATGLPIDLIIANRKVLSHRYGLRPVFVQTTNGDVFIRKAYFDLTLTINGVLFMVKGVNTSSLSEVNVYTEEFGLRIPNDATKDYFVFRNGQITSVGYVSTVPKDSYVVMINKELVRQFLGSLRIGSRVSFEVQPDGNYIIKNAVGAGPLLLQDGRPIPDANEEKLRYGGGISTTRTSRTVIAIKSGLVHLITIEGGSGTNYDETVQFLQSKGYESAMMLDGGGSTAMVYNGKYMTSISPRDIPVALGLR